MKLRDYQSEAVKRIWGYFAAGGKGNPIVALPTGTGKSLIIGSFIANAVNHFPGQRMLMATHSKTLVYQNAETLKRVWPYAPIGIVSAGLGKAEFGLPITYGGIGSLYRHVAKIGHIDILFVDECHAISDAESSMYQKLIKGLLKINPKMKVVGLSATPYRAGVGHLTEGGLFTDVCFDATTPEWIAWFVSEGYLVPLITKKTSTYIDTDGVRMVAGDYAKGQIQDAATKEGISYNAIFEALPAIVDRRSVLHFTTGIEHVEQVAEVLAEFGEDVDFVHSKMTKPFDEVMDAFKSLKCKHMVSMGQLTTGFDHPALDCIVILRPTKSTSLWVQMLGRGTRPVYCLDSYLCDDGVWRVPDLSTREGRLKAIEQSPKQNCLVLDFARNIEDIGPFDDPRLPKKKGKGGGEPIMKACETDKLIHPAIGCGTYNWGAARYCTDCGSEFEFKPKIHQTTTGSEVMTKGKKSDLPPIKNWPVQRVTFERHRKDGKPDSVRASYYSGLRRFTTYLCPEHGGGATAMARRWWAKHMTGAMPTSIAEFESRLVDARIPVRIDVEMKKDYPNIREYYFDD